MSDEADNVRWAVRCKDGRWLDELAVATRRWTRRHLHSSKAEAEKAASTFRRHHGARIVRVTRKVATHAVCCGHIAGGNCWHNQDDDVCMKHEEPRGECNCCPRCPKCDEAP